MAKITHWAVYRLPDLRVESSQRVIAHRFRVRKLTILNLCNQNRVLLITRPLGIPFRPNNLEQASVQRLSDSFRLDFPSRGHSCIDLKRGQRSKGIGSCLNINNGNSALDRLVLKGARDDVLLELMLPGQTDTEVLIRSFPARIHSKWTKTLGTQNVQIGISLDPTKQQHERLAGQGGASLKRA